MIEDIRVFDWEFHFLCNLNRYNSLNWQLFYNEIGNFEGHFPKDSKIVDLVMSNRYLLIVQGNKQAIVTGYFAGDDFAVYGRTVNWLLSRRVAPVLATETAVDVETYARGLVSSAFSGVTGFVLGPCWLDTPRPHTFKPPGKNGKPIRGCDCRACDGSRGARDDV